MPNTKDQYPSMYEISRIAKSIEREKRLVIAMSWEDEGEGE